jgi:hypothetical protein
MRRAIAVALVCSAILALVGAAPPSGARPALRTVYVTPAFEAGLHQVADDLTSQCVVTSVRPEGGRTSDRISVSLKKPGFTRHAPSRVPN